MEFYEDKYSQDTLEAYKDEDGEYFLGDSGDPLIDKWEEELRMGLEPDLTEGMTKEELLKLEEEKVKFRKARQLKQEVDGIDEDFSAYPEYKPIKGAYSGDKIVKNRNPSFDKKNLLGQG